MSNVFQVDSDIVKKARDLDNYFVVEDDTIQPKSNICAVYFSSNYIYFPNTTESFNKAILQKDRYEWWNLRHPKANKHIFIRDIHKQWYLHGINSEINSLELLADFLKQETKGFETYFIGSSAGGYAAVLLGSLLKVERIYSFNNQFFLTDLLKNSSEPIDPIVFREQHNSEISKFYNIKSYINNPSSIFYFHSNKSEWDIRQFDEVKNLEMNVVSVNTTIHGIPILKNNLTHLFNLDKNELKRLTQKKLNPIGFSIQIIGLPNTALFLFKMIPNAFRRFIINPLYNKLRR